VLAVRRQYHLPHVVFPLSESETNGRPSGRPFCWARAGEGIELPGGRVAEKRDREIHKATTPEEIEPTVQCFRDFVALCECKEAETGKLVAIVAGY
jgi:hypothetical protein